MTTKEHRSAEVLEDLEYRTITVSLEDVQVRTSGSKDGGVNFDGHAAVFNTETILYKTNDWQISERIDPGAFADVLATNPDVHLNINHDMQKVMARTNVDGLGGMRLEEDISGLHVFARLDDDVTYISDLVKLMQRGVIDQMSFAFLPGEYTLETRVDGDGYETDLYTHHSFAGLKDVCVCPRGAYPTTDAGVRNLIQERTEVRTLDRVASTETGTPELVAQTKDSVGAVQNETIAQGKEPVGSDAAEEERIAAQKLSVKKQMAKIRVHPQYERGN